MFGKDLYHSWLTSRLLCNTRKVKVNLSLIAGQQILSSRKNCIIIIITLLLMIIELFLDGSICMLTMQ